MPQPKDATPELWHPAKYTDAEHRAIQTLIVYAQTAVMPPEPGREVPVPSAMDVRLAFDWIIHGAAMTYDNGFVPNDPHGRIAAFVDGRQYVGQQIVKLAKLKIEKGEPKDKE